MPREQILWMLEPLNFLSIFVTHQWNKQINLNFFFLGFHVIEEIYQIRTDNRIKSINLNKINKLWCIAYHQNKRILKLTIIWFHFIEILEIFLFNFFFNGLYGMMYNNPVLKSPSFILFTNTKFPFFIKKFKSLVEESLERVIEINFGGKDFKHI